MTQDGTLTLTIPAGVINDLAGVGNVGFTANYIVQVNSQPFPALAGAPPAGSLIYDPTVTGAINFVGDSDSYTLNLAAGQQISGLLTTDPNPDRHAHPLGSGRRDRLGDGCGSRTATSTSRASRLRSPASTPSRLAGSGTGNYTLQAVLNAYVKPDDRTNNSIGSAVDLSSSFIPPRAPPTAPTAPASWARSTRLATPITTVSTSMRDSRRPCSTQGQNGQVSLGLFDSSGNLLALPGRRHRSRADRPRGGFAGAGSQL